MENGSQQEKIVGLHECQSDVTGEAIASNILKYLTTWQLDPHLLQGQTFAGADAVAGRTNGVAAHITSLYPRAVYNHCAETNQVGGATPGLPGFCDLFLPIIISLEVITNSGPIEWNRETRLDPQSLLLAMLEFKFIIALPYSHSEYSGIY